MKVHRYSEHQRRLWVHEMMHKTKTVKAICKEAQISRATLYNWLSEFTKNRAKPNEEPQPTEALLSWQPNDKYKMLLSALLKVDADKTVSRKLVRELVKRYNVTPSQACALVNLPEENYQHRPRKPEADDKEVYAALVHLLNENRSRSLEDCIAILQQQQPNWTVKQIRRIYRQGRLYLKRTRIRHAVFLPENKTVATDILLPQRLRREAAFWYVGCVKEEKCWLLFLLDYEDGTPLNAMAGEGEWNEEHVMQLMHMATEENGLPKKVRIPNVAPFVSRELSKWSWENKVALYQLSMAKPENLLEADYIKDDIKKQLMIDATTTLQSLQKVSEEWIVNFAQKQTEAINYFVKEEVI